MAQQQILKGQKPNLARVRKAAALLQHHHGSGLPLVISQLLMSQQCSCQWCQSRNGPSKDFCGGCGSHWQSKSQANRRQKSVSRSKSQENRRRRSTKGKGKGTYKTQEQGEETSGSPFAPFQQSSQPLGNVAPPWQVSTPSRTIQNAAIPTSPGPSQPVAQVTQSLPAQFMDIQSELQAAGVELPQKLLQTIEAFGKQLQPVQAITHRHVAQVNCLEGLVQQSMTNIQRLDDRWNSFRTFVKERWKEQRTLYQAQRDQEIQSYQELTQQLQAARDEAAQGLEGLTKTEPPPVPPAPPVLHVESDTEEEENKDRLNATLAAAEVEQEAAMDVERQKRPNPMAPFGSQAEIAKKTKTTD